jgi:hypothetical protein
MTVFTNSIPASGHTLAFDQPLMLANNEYLQTSVGTDHNFTANTSTSQDGYHKVIHFVNQVSDPSPVTSTGQLYTKTVSSFNQLFYENPQGNIIQLTNFSSNADANARFATNTNYLTSNTGGWTFLPGGLVLQYGSFAASSSSTYNITFPIPFPSGNPPFSVTISGTRASSSPGSSASWVSTSGLSSTGFTIFNDGAHNFGWYWLAIGN